MLSQALALLTRGGHRSDLRNVQKSTTGRPRTGGYVAPCSTDWQGAYRSFGDNLVSASLAA